MICRESKTVATSARSVLRIGENPSTLTDSLTAPGSSRTFNGVCVSTLTLMSGKSATLNPGSSAFTSYVPGSSRSFR